MSKEEFDPNWFYPQLSRQEAESMLSETGANVFVLRNSSVASSFALSQYDSFQNIFIHHLIKPINSIGWKIEDSPDNQIYSGVGDAILNTPILEGYRPLGDFFPPQISPKPTNLNPLLYYGAISRVEAESLLIASNTNTMLLRNSSVPGTYALSKYDISQKKCFHILIEQVTTGYRMQDALDVNTYRSIDDMIAKSVETVSFVALGSIQKTPVKAKQTAEPGPAKGATFPAKKTAVNPPVKGSSSFIQAPLNPQQRPRTTTGGSALIAQSSPTKTSAPVTPMPQTTPVKTPTVPMQQTPVTPPTKSNYINVNPPVKSNPMNINNPVTPVTPTKSNYINVTPPAKSNINTNAPPPPLQRDNTPPQNIMMNAPPPPPRDNTPPQNVMTAPPPLLATPPIKSGSFLMTGPPPPNRPNPVTSPPIKQSPPSTLNKPPAEMNQMKSSVPPPQPPRPSSVELPRNAPQTFTQPRPGSVLIEQPSRTAITNSSSASSVTPTKSSNAPQQQPQQPLKKVESSKELKKKEKEEEKARKLREKEMKKNKGKGKAMVIEGPTNVVHVSHVGFDGGSGFQIRNIPVEWKRMFKEAGIKKSDLEDAETAKMIFSTISDALSQQQSAPEMQSPIPPRPNMPPRPNTQPSIPANRPMPPPPSLSVPSSSQSREYIAMPPTNKPPPRLQETLYMNRVDLENEQDSYLESINSEDPYNNSDRPLPPPPMDLPPPPEYIPLPEERELPPPPPPVNLSGPPLPSRSNPAPPAPAPPPVNVAKPSENSLQNQIVNAQLRAVQKGALPPIQKNQEKNLLGMLSAAMASRRQALKDDDKEEEGGEEDWSDEDWN